jgi:small-conductance mechanosensitive channel
MPNSALRIGLSILLGIVGMIALQVSVKTGEKRLKKSGVQGERLKRLITLWQVGRSIGGLLLILITSLMVLHELGINIMPVLASAGVIGLAFSLGSQTVIKDYLGGILVLTESQFTVGDVITIGNVTGTVEGISLRATYLRDAEGKRLLIPNGDIRTVSNLTTQWAQVVITLNVDYEADMGHVLHALEEASKVLESDQEIASGILDAPTTLGWTGFTDWAVQVQITVRTKPGMQWAVGRALRKAALESFQKEGIRVALPKQRIENTTFPQIN